MIETNRARLRGEFVENYDDLVRDLARRLGSSDFAREALHETFLRLDRGTEGVSLRSPADYIFRIAINIAKDRQRAQSRRLRTSESDALLEIRDDGADLARIVEARSEIEALKRALAELPARPREILHSISVEGQPVQQVAARLSVSIRTVNGDLKLALSHCAKRLDCALIRRSGGPRFCA
ncbi:RNA polymerase sigma-70 factor (ECF subfamily) [Bradyrhizobium embrapense]